MNASIAQANSIIALDKRWKWNSVKNLWREFPSIFACLRARQLGELSIIMSHDRGMRFNCSLH